MNIRLIPALQCSAFSRVELWNSNHSLLPTSPMHELVGAHRARRLVAWVGLLSLLALSFISSVMAASGEELARPIISFDDERHIYEQSRASNDVPIEIQEAFWEPNYDEFDSQTTSSSSISASPNPCISGAGTSVCSTTVQWSHSTSPVSVYIVNPVTNSESLVATSGAIGSVSVPWISQWPGYDWVLRYNGVNVATDYNVYARQHALDSTRGGSNYNWYNIGAGNDFIPYGIVKNYSATGVRATVQNQLATMYSNGQRELRYMVHFCQTCTTNGTYLNSGPKSGPNGTHHLSAQDALKLSNFLSDIQSAGFSRVHIAMGPGSLNDIGLHCTSMTPSKYQEMTAENWAFTKEVIAVLESSGMSYLIDLYNEGIHNNHSYKVCQRDYLAQTWSDYRAIYSIQKTVGFSVIVMSDWDAYNRVALIDEVYQGVPPSFLELHSYSTSANPTGQAALRAANEVIRNILPGQYQQIPWIVGETYYNNATFAGGLRLGSLDTGSKVSHVLQWPKESNGNWVVPLLFNNYIASGF